MVEHHWHLPNLGDMTQIDGRKAVSEYGAINLLVGGTPCQSFSVAGLRKGMADPRGNLALDYLRLADSICPRWLVWENVPGVLSSNEGRDFGSFLGALGELGFGWSYRVLDAQFFGVAQRRRRVFVVGCLGDWRGATAVLFERESLWGDSPPRREKGKGVARSLGASTGGCSAKEEQYTFADQDGRPLSALGTFQNTGHGWWNESPCAQTIRRPDGGGSMEANVVAFGSKDDGRDATEECSPTLRAGVHDCSDANAGTPPAVAFAQNTRDEVRLVGGDGQVAGALAAEPGMKQQTYVAQPTAPCLRTNHHNNSDPTMEAQMLVAHTPEPIPIHNTDIGMIERDRERDGAGVGEEGDPMYTLGGRSPRDAVATAMAVRRLTPRECERLQGFPDDYTLITYRNKPAADGPRYRGLGNSMAVPVMRWIGERIAAVERAAPTAQEDTR